MVSEKIKELVEISRYYGIKKDYVIAGGGNTSYKDNDDIWVKASGTGLSDITKSGFAILKRNALQKMYDKKYSEDPVKREEEVKTDLYNACHPGITVRPSVETSLHEIIKYSFIMHTHPTLVNALTCSINAEKYIMQLFGDDALYIPYTDPGYTLFVRIRNLLLNWRETHKQDPKIIFLQNHGVFVSADSTNEIREIYDHIETVISKHISIMHDMSESQVPDNITDILPALRMLFSEDSIKVCQIRNNSLAKHFTSDKKSFNKISLPFTPDQIVYCKARPLYIEESSADAIINACSNQIREYEKSYGYPPKIVGLKGYGIIAFEEKGKTDPLFRELFKLIAKTKGLWNTEAEAYLMENAKSI